MKISYQINILLLIISHFVPDVSSYPPPFPPNTTTGPWDSFTKLSGTHSGQQIPGLSNLKTYLNRFGYNTTNFTDNFDHELESAVKQYQKNFKLNTSGELDESTVKQMLKPRCGVPDIVNGSMPMYGHPFATIEVVTPLPEGRFSYAFDPGNEVSGDVKRVFVRAFNRWSKWAALEFTEVSNYSDADFKIGFYAGDHGDGEEFDGVLGTLAHAFARPRGSLHMDRGETWVIDGDGGFTSEPATAIDLESVAVHGIGHLLGLGHSSVEEAVMFPTISPGVRKVELAGDDVESVLTLYGRNTDNNGLSFGESEKIGGHRETLGLVHILIVVGLLLWL